MDESKGLNLEELLRPVEKAHETIACKAECRVGILHPLLYTRGSWPRKIKRADGWAGIILPLLSSPMVSPNHGMANLRNPTKVKLY